jgi:hypothetical protein
MHTGRAERAGECSADMIRASHTRVGELYVRSRKHPGRDRQTTYALVNMCSCSWAADISCSNLRRHSTGGADECSPRTTYVSL